VINGRLFFNNEMKKTKKIQKLYKSRPESRHSKVKCAVECCNMEVRKSLMEGHKR
jgi:hypothetical protein